MTDNAAINTQPTSSWQLRAEFTSTFSQGGQRQVVNQVTEIMRGLDLQSPQLERIQNATLEAVQKASLRAQPAEPIAPVHIRIWIAGACAGGRGWGFFLVEKPGSASQGAPGESEHLVELFLYQERDSQ